MAAGVRGDHAGDRGDERSVRLLLMNGKGDDARPLSVTQEEFSARWPMERKPAPRGMVYKVGVGWVPKDRPLLTQGSHLSWDEAS